MLILKTNKKELTFNLKVSSFLLRLKALTKLKL